MSVFLLLFTFFNFLIVFKKQNEIEKGIFTRYRIAILESLLAISFLIFIFVEVLSFFNRLNSFYLSVCWFFAFLLSSIIAYPQRDALSDGKKLLSQFGILNQKYRWFLFFLLLFGIIPLLFLAIYNAPNNRDSMDYHLARIVQWVQNGNVDHFATNFPQQLYHNVFAEYVVTNVMLLCGNDYFINCIQFVAMLAVLLYGTLIAKHFGLSYKGQIIALVLIFSFPIELLESTTTQNDIFASFYLMAFVYYGLKLINNQQFVWRDGFFMVLALSLGGFTKYPVFFFALPFSVWFGIVCLRRFGLPQSMKLLALGFCGLALVFSSFYVRNYELFDSVLSPRKNTRIYVENIDAEKHGVRETLANLSKNLSLHVGLPSQPYNEAVALKVKEFNNWMGIDADDERLSLNGGGKYEVLFSLNEDTTGNFLLLILLAISIPLFFFMKNKPKDSTLFLICILAGYVVFSSLVKWQAFSSRTQIGFFVATAIFIAMVFSSFRKFPALGFMYVLLLSSFPFIYGNPNKPVLPFNYLAKKMIGYAPKSILIVDKEQNVETYKENPLIQRYYDFEKPFFPLKAPVNKTEERQIFQTLDSLKYFDYLKTDVFNTTRYEQYFIHDSNIKGDKDFAELLKHLPANTQNLGMMFQARMGFYHLWKMFRDKYGDHASMKYIVYLKDYQKLDNVKKPFPYQYIVADSESLVNENIIKGEIENVEKFGEFLLIKLKKVSDKRYLL